MLVGGDVSGWSISRHHFACTYLGNPDSRAGGTAMSSMDKVFLPSFCFKIQNFKFFCFKQVMGFTASELQFSCDGVSSG